MLNNIMLSIMSLYYSVRSCIFVLFLNVEKSFDLYSIFLDLVHVHCRHFCMALRCFVFRTKLRLKFND